VERDSMVAASTRRSYKRSLLRPTTMIGTYITRDLMVAASTCRSYKRSLLRPTATIGTYITISSEP
jgi:hypothetical protein